jgi:hypothetical protein
MIILFFVECKILYDAHAKYVFMSTFLAATCRIAAKKNGRSLFLAKIDEVKNNLHHLVQE